MGASFGGRKDQEWFEEEFLVPMGCAGPDACCAEVAGLSYKIIVVGLDGAGKTSLCLRLCGRQNEVPIRTGMEEVIYDNKMAKERMCKWVVPAPGQEDVTMHVIDVGGRVDYRHLWCYRFRDVTALVFVVDACDPSRLGEAQCALYEHVLPQVSAANLPLLLILHEKAGQTPMSDEEILSGLGVDEGYYPGLTPKGPRQTIQKEAVSDVSTESAAMIAATLLAVYAGQGMVPDRDVARQKIMYRQMHRLLPSADLLEIVRVHANCEDEQISREVNDAMGSLVQRVTANIAALKAADLDLDEELGGEEQAKEDN